MTLPLSQRAKAELAAMLLHQFELNCDYVYGNDTNEEFISGCALLDEIAAANEIELEEPYEKSAIDYIDDHDVSTEH